MALGLLGGAVMASPAAASDLGTVDVDPHFVASNPDFGTATAILTDDAALHGGDSITFSSAAGYFDRGPNLDLTRPTTLNEARLYAWPERWDADAGMFIDQCSVPDALAELGLADYQDCVDAGIITELGLVRGDDGDVTITVPTEWSPPRVATGFVIRQFYVGFVVQPDPDDEVCSPACFPSHMINVAATFTAPAYSIPGDGTLLDLTPATKAESITVDMASPTPVKLPMNDGVARLSSSLVLATSSTVVSLPAGVRLSSTDASWDGMVSPPTELATTAVTSPEHNGVTGEVTAVVQVGSTSDELEFDTAARLVLTGQGGKTAAYQRVGDTGLTLITAACSEDSVVGLGANPECATTVGDDLVIWTTHFTTFAALDYTATEPDPVRQPTDDAEPARMIPPTGPTGLELWAGAAAAVMLTAGAVLLRRGRRSDRSTVG